VSSLKKLFWISLIVKIILAALLPLTNDEAYYWVWSLHPQLSYYDHPPFVAWLFWIGERLPQIGTSVRWPGVLLAHATLYVWLKVLEPYLDENQRRQWLWLALLSPLVGGSALIVTPDVPLMFFYALALGLFFRWQKTPDFKWSLAFGLAMGVGFSSKYMMVLFVLSLLPFTLWSPKLRGPLMRSLPWMFLGAVAGAAPVWVWNVMNDFASFKFQAAHGLGRKFWKPSWTFHYIGAQIGLIFPVILYWAIRARRNLPAVFHFLAWTPLAFFLFTTYRGYVEANWPIVAYPAIFALAVSAYPLNLRAIQGTVLLWGVLIASMAVIVIAQPPWSKALKFREFHQFDRAVAVAKPYEPLYARSYQMAAKMHFELKRPVYKLKGMNRRDFFDYLEDSEPKTSPYYVVVEKNEPLPPSYTSRGHKIAEKIAVDDRYEIVKVEAQPQ
jgi:4-amino-4-deoxy-L-arabinose transferase-like glycosyltransferase